MWHFYQMTGYACTQILMAQDGNFSEYNNEYYLLRYRYAHYYPICGMLLC
jgi:hypothetical protein